MPAKNQALAPDTSRISPSAQPPEAAKSVTFKLENVVVNGGTAFSHDEIAKIYAPYLHRQITLDMVWLIADQITKKYRDEGYFLTRAYVPEQEIENGTVKINIVEGYVGRVEVDPSVAKYAIVQDLIARIKAEKPVQTKQLESTLLRLSDVPGLDFRAAFEPLKNAPEGAVLLRLIPSKEKGAGQASINNYGSQFLGPLQASATYQASFLPMQETTLTYLNSIPTRDINYGALSHRIALTPETSLIFSGNYAKVRPGYTLETSDIDGNALQGVIGLNYQAIRQRDKNLLLSVSLDAKNVRTDTLGFPLTRDRIRALRASASYDMQDGYGRNLFNATLSQGIGFLGASKEKSFYLSRAEADPDFTKLELSVLRQQFLGRHVLASGEIAGQVANNPLFSSEEFGFGGQRFGRAYDPSEVTGDNGLAASVELRYWGSKLQDQTGIYPFVFYDIGKVWNKDTGGENTLISSAGGGLRMTPTSTGFSAAFTVAQPLIHGPGAPPTDDVWAPRLLFEAGYSF